MEGDYIYMVRNTIQPEIQEEYNEWQNTEHIPWICTVDGYHSCQRFQSQLDPYAYLNLWVIDGPACYDDPRKQKISRSPWGLRLRRYRQFTTTFYHRVAAVEEGVTTGPHDCLLTASFPSAELASALTKALETGGAAKDCRGFSEVTLYQSIRGRPGWMLCLRADGEHRGALLGLAARLVQAGGAESLKWEQHRAISPVIRAEQFRTQNSSLIL